MELAQATALLRKSESELRAAGVVSASLFGSLARGEAGPDSDIDVAVRLSKDFANGGFAFFDRFDELRALLSRILGVDVDLVEEPVRKARLQAEIDKDRALAF